jgi:hypothetical protein
MRNFCTLFDTSYLSRGLALYRSLIAVNEDFRLYVFCFDDIVYDVLRRLNLDRLVPVSLADFESPGLLRVKPGRTKGEYCWTCTSHTIRYALDTFSLPEVTYLDADLFFYAPPSVLLDEFDRSGASVLITPHRYTRRYDISWRSGIYCVQFITFRADERGLRALDWWRERCLEWCYARVENGKFGDQKYLDDWPTRFPGVHVLEHLGGVAPWNVQQYDIERKNGKLTGRERRTGHLFDVVFFHFHNVRFLTNGYIDMGDYYLRPPIKEVLFQPYVEALVRSAEEISRVDATIDPHGKRPPAASLLQSLLRLRRRWMKNYLSYDEFRKMTSDVMEKI